MSEQLDLLTVKVQRILADFLNDVRLNDRGGFMIPYESTMVVVEPKELENERTAVLVFALMNQNVPATPALYEWVARNTDNFMFGHIGIRVDEEGKFANLVFTHTLLGDYLDPEELKQAVGAVATTANDLDEEVQDRFGGERWVDPAGDANDD
jgi:Putative bacterial sensory transduction regulator